MKWANTGLVVVLWRLNLFCTSDANAEEEKKISEGSKDRRMLAEAREEVVVGDGDGGWQVQIG
jgi:hypothetical protein